MKTTLLFLSVFLTTSLFGQNVYIPDANFKAYLVGNPDINTNGDTEIQVSEANVFDGAISCSNQNISDLTGIEAFIAIWYLNCYENQLTSLDVSQNSDLTDLGCGANQLTSLDVSQNTLLEELDCNYNQLTALDLSQNTLLEELDCNYNQLTSLDVSQNTALSSLLCAGNQLTSLDLSNNTSLSWLKCLFNQLTSLDVSQNLALEDLECAGNQLTSLDLSQNVALNLLGCGLNQLTSLDLSQNTALTKLMCAQNQLISLDVSQNTALTDLYCPNNQLNCLNVANGNNINFFEFEATGNPNLTCIQVDDVTISNDWYNAVDLFGFDPQTSFSENCNYPSDCFTTSLTELSTSKNLIQILDMMGRETTFKPNTPLIFVYDDGSTEKVFTIE